MISPNIDLKYTLWWIKDCNYTPVKFCKIFQTFVASLMTRQYNNVYDLRFTVSLVRFTHRYRSRWPYSVQWARLVINIENSSKDFSPRNTGSKCQIFRQWRRESTQTSPHCWCGHSHGCRNGTYIYIYI